MTGDERYVFASDPSKQPRPGGEDGREPWTVLIVDDDPAVHATTRMVLRDLVVDGRPIRFLSAWSDAEARRVFAETPDIAVALVDVVMESEDAGLRLVRHIRETLGNRSVRIILRTGQPGQAPERDVALNHDINDYKSKTELTASRLVTSVLGGLRGYRDITAIERHRAGLERILDASRAVMGERATRDVIAAALDGLVRVVPEIKRVVIIERPTDPDGQPLALGARGLGDDPLRDPPNAAREVALRALDEGRHVWTAERGALLFPARGDRGDLLLVVGHDRPITDEERALVEVLCSHVAVALENARLHEDLSRLNRELEDRVRERTRAAEEASAHARAADRAKSLFLATMSHEIRTPMNGVHGMLELLERSPLTSAQREHLDTARDSARDLLRIIDDILDFSKIEAGRIDLERVPMSLTEATEAVAETLAPRAREAGLDLHVHIDPDLPEVVEGDPVRVRQVLTNIVGNALKFTERGSVRVRVEAVGFEGDRLTVAATVTDTGVGIDPPALERLFQPFIQAEASTTRRFGGTGLGLSICRRLTELMGGRIEAESRPGEGSTFRALFTVGLPARAETRPTPLSEGTVVAVDIEDEDERRDLTRYALADGASVVPMPPSAGGTTIDVLITDRAERVGASGARRSVLIARATAPVPGATVVTRPIRRARLARAIAGRGDAGPPDARGDEPGGARQTARLDAPLILLAEDHPTNRLVISRQLAVLGYRREAAVDGTEALRMWRAGRYAAVLTDHLMPGLDGRELTRIIRAEEEREGTGRHIPIIALTADATVGSTEANIAAGMDAGLTKPVDIDTLGRTLRGLIPDSPAVDAPPLDPADLRALFDGDEAAVDALMREFVEVNRATLAATRGGSRGEIRRAAHKLGGSAHQVGAGALAAAAAELERDAETGDAEFVDAATARLEAEFARVAAWIAGRSRGEEGE